jgi:hypothetical protein
VLLFEVRLTLAVREPPIVVAPTVDLNHQISLRAVEIDDERSDGVLPPKLETLKAPAPEADERVSGGASMGV